LPRVQPRAAARDGGRLPLGPATGAGDQDGCDGGGDLCDGMARSSVLHVSAGVCW